MKKVSIFIMVFTVMSKILGFIREWVLSSTYGKSVFADAFVFSYNLPSQIFAVLITAFVTGFIPMFTKVEKEQGDQAANEFANNTLNVMVFFVTIVSVIVYIFATPIIQNVFLRNASAQLIQIVIPFFKITLGTIIFSCIFSLLQGYLQVRNSFLFSIMVAFPLNIIIILTLLLSRKFGPDILPYGILIAFIVQAILIWTYARMKGFKFKPALRLNDPYLIKMLVLALPVMVASGASSIGGIIINNLASGFDGGLSIMNYSVRLGAMVDGIFGMAIISVVYPNLSRAISLNQIEKAEEEMSDSIISILLFVLPAAIGLFILAQPISQFVFQSNQFNLDAILQMVPVLKAYAIMIPMSAVYNLVTRVFFAFHDMKTPTVLSIILISLFVVLANFFTPIFGLSGIMIGQTVSYSLIIFVQLFLVNRKMVSFKYGEFFAQILKILIASLIMGAVVWGCYNLLIQFVSLRIAVVITLFIAILIYAILILMLHLKTVDALIASLRKKVRG